MEPLKTGDWVKIPEDQEGRSLAQVKELYPENSMKAKLYWPSEESTAICTQMQHYARWKPEPREYCWRKHDGNYILFQYLDTKRATWDLQPFFGELPSNLKDL